ncbi:MAG: hypothetical protein COW67_14270 [Flavobacteriales bacterium CG18_big_fil_WC_8_21_14_2_50_32_9]|nr:hypothetical protein [Flavobacteriales bacterium]PIQ14370.1 MAG: hypothetical protein COW67_14270 [Flavobacteriales bacterium CG18_big_fil_WC_8_21_14_2_50_32_9]PJC61973.1 MAG: hypothetical protein CO022_07050 [Flavobacteriales bacterium CG_4_9_14_0_2_um_filter_32_27]
MNKIISAYLSKKKVLSFATSLNNIPYSANCYYVFDNTNYVLLFLSDENTRHIKEAVENENVAGTITTDAKTIVQLQGVQFTGKFIIPDETQKEQFYKVYYNKFPFAKAKPSKIWGISLEYLKMTDNTLGFGTKHLWERGHFNPSLR